MTKLCTLIGAVSLQDIEINHLELDSRKIQKDDCFVAMKGESFDGKDFIDDAIAKGAKVVLADAEVQNEKVVYIPDLKKQLSKIASNYYNNPEKDLKIIGITGTNGKTTTAYFIHQLLTGIGIPCGFIGTVGYGVNEPFIESKLTTENPIEIQKRLSELRREGAKVVVMEVSSHALTQYRVQNIEFDLSIFTNLSQDHLDYHSSMEEYFKAKKKLFYQTKKSLINIENTYGRELATELSCSTYSVSNNADYRAEVLKNPNELEIRLCEKNIKLPFLGKFNIENLLAALGAVDIIANQFPLELVSGLKLPKGRMQLVKVNDVNVVIDYAHTPDSLKKLLQEVKPYSHKLWCVFGCGGQRDKGKRALMTEAAVNYSDFVIITSDNPRAEPVEDIIEDMLYNLKNRDTVKIEKNRKLAIELAIKSASKDDYVVIAGKGHEEYQLINGQKLQFSDLDVVKSLEKSYV